MRARVTADPVEWGMVGRNRWLCGLLLGVVVALWVASFWRGYNQQGLFLWLGVDFRHYYAQAMALRVGDLDTLYSREAGVLYGQALAVYSAYPDRALEPTLVPYPPLFPALFVPFTLLPPPIGFALWTGLSLLTAAYMAWRVAGCFERGRRCWAVLTFVAMFSLGYALYLGQVMILLACAFLEFYRALRAGHDVRAGLWLACLLFKPQYGFLLGVLLLWKGRWRVVAGVAAGGIAIALSSLALVGPRTMLAMPAAILDLTEGFDGEGNTSYPQDMINWRKLVRYLTIDLNQSGPFLSDELGVALTVALSVASALAALHAWRGPWAPADPDFPVKMAVLMMATILGSYHSHAYGPLLLLMPVAAMLATGRVRRTTGLLLLAAAVVPMLLWVTIYKWYIAALAGLLVASFGALLYELWARDHQPGPAPVHASSPDRMPATERR
jgi:hypothetical protein